MTCACTLCVICNLYMLITQELCEGPAESAHMKVYGGTQTTCIVIWKWSSPCNLLLNISTILQEMHTYIYGILHKGSVYLATLLSPRTLPFGRYPTDTFPWNGTRWCSHKENSSMSFTTTISSWFSLNTPPPTTPGVYHIHGHYSPIPNLSSHTPPKIKKRARGQC